LLRRASLILAALIATPAGAQQAALNDYPTDARADYVFACMASNGQSRPMLEKCSCSIDHIASVLPYERYVDAETILRTLQMGGEKVGVLRTSERHKAMVADLRRAQAEADILCF
jgi:hypothetical protein